MWPASIRAPKRALATKCKWQPILTTCTSSASQTKKRFGDRAECQSTLGLMRRGFCFSPDNLRQGVMHMTNEERVRKIEVYGSAYDLLTEALKEFPPEMWQYRSAPNDWTIHEIVV